MTALHGRKIAQQLGRSRATVSRVLRRLKLNRIRDLELTAGAPPL